MTEKLKQIIQEEVGKLPKEAQDAINALDWAKTAEEIGKKRVLSESEINDFQVETLLILTGIEDPNLYALNIENEVGVSKGEAEKIAGEAAEKIFIPINDIYIENIKKSGKIINSKWDQNLNFVLSGGNYQSFIDPTRENFPRDGNNIPIKPKITDIKNKFTI